MTISGNVFDSGVKGYVMATCQISIGFPIDMRDRYHVSCKLCDLFNGKRCIATKEIVPFPETHTGYECPLKFTGIEGIIDEEKEG